MSGLSRGRHNTPRECNALVLCGKENIWEREFLQTLNIFSEIPPTIVYEDNKSSITLSGAGTHHKRSKHFGLEWEIFKEYLKKKEMEIIHKNTEDLQADMLTKSLTPNNNCRQTREKPQRNIFNTKTVCFPTHKHLSTFRFTKQGRFFRIFNR